MHSHIGEGEDGIGVLSTHILGCFAIIFIQLTSTSTVYYARIVEYLVFSCKNIAHGHLRGHISHKYHQFDYIWNHLS